MSSGRQHIRALAIGIALVGALLASAGPAEAASGSIKDGRDGKSKLDVASVSYSRAADRSLTHTIRFHSPVQSRLLKEKGNLLAFAFDTDGNRKADRVGVVLWADGALRGGVVDTKGRLLALARVRRPNSRSIAVTIPGRALDVNGGYRWILLSEYKARGRCRKGCLDAVPNGGPALFDFTAPLIDIRVPDLAALPSTAYAVHVGTRDPGFSGLRKWTLEFRTAGQTEWTMIGEVEGRPGAEIPLAGTEGTTYEFRLSAVDKAGNRSTTTRLFTMPIDDASPLLAGAYSGRWDAVVNPSPLLFMGTFHRSDSTDATFTYSFTGTYVAWLAATSCCTSVNVSIDGGPPQRVMVTGQRKPFERADLHYGPHTLTIAVPPGSSPGFSIDAVVSR
jgi:hypothetical protein